MARLGDVFSLIRNGASIKQTEGAGGFPITRIETIANRKVDRNKFGYANIIDITKYKSYILQDGDILMSHINSEKHLGKVALYKKQPNEQIIHGMNLLILRAKSEILSPIYAAYFFETPIFFRQIQKITKKSVNQASFTVTALKELQIPLPSLDEQRRIATTLDKVTDLISKRRQQLDKLDELVKARFVEMFEGKSFKIVKTCEVCEFITKGTTPPNTEIYTEYKPGRIPFLKVYNLSFTGSLLFDEHPQYISKEIHDGILSRSKVYPNDVLMNIVGPPLGKFSLVTSQFPEWNVNQAIAIFRSKPCICPRYLEFALMQPSVLRPFLNQAVGVRQLNLSLQQCRDLEICLPPIELQNQFATFVMQIDKLKATISRSLEKLEILKKALMQEYFGENQVYEF